MLFSKIHVKVAPTSSTKSRVETQIKLCLSLVHSNGIHAPYWSYIRIPSSFIAKQKPHSRHLLLDGSTAAMVSDESKVLDLEARVICESDPDKEVYMCAGCVRRERKRAERRKNTKPTSYRLNAGRVDKEFEHERKRILLLNCEPLVAFHTLTADLLVRITCYCRHQNERLGYRIRFSLKNYHGQTVASGESPLLMITDDHKKPHTPASCNMPSENAALQPLDSMIVHHANGQFHFPPEDCHTNNPTINYVVPEVGPLTGGIEVTLLGENLNQDLMVMFGNHPAILVSSDEYSLVCLLPPAQEQGACALFFRNKPVGHTYFTYHDWSQQDISDLACHIYDPFYKPPFLLLEPDILFLLSQHDLNLSQTNMAGQTLLHLACHLEYTQLVIFLIRKEPRLIEYQDKNGLTAICFGKTADIIQCLIKLILNEV